jgi:hypothetical protein
MTDDGHDQGGPYALEHAVERAAEAVVIQSSQVAVVKAEEVWWEGRGPLGYAIDGLACQEEIGEEDEQGGDGREFGAGVVSREIFAEDAPQLHPLDDSLEQRECPDVIGAEFESIGPGVLARDDSSTGAARCGRACVWTLGMSPRIDEGNRRK